MRPRTSQLLANCCRAALLLGAVASLAVAGIWRLFPGVVDAWDERLQLDYVQGPDQRLQRALALVASDRPAAIQQLEGLHQELLGVRRGDRLEQVAPLVHYFLSQVLLDAGSGAEAVAVAKALPEYDPHNVDGLVHYAKVRVSADVDRAAAIVDLQALHGRLPGSVKVTVELVRALLLGGDVAGVARVLAEFERAPRSNRWLVSYLLQGAPLDHYNMLQQGLLVPLQGDDGAQTFRFQVAGTVDRLRIELPPEPLLRLVQPRLHVAGQPVATLTPSAKLEPVGDAYEVRAAAGLFLDYFVPATLPPSPDCEFTARLEPVLAFELVELLAVPIEPLLAALPAADAARIRKYQLGKRLGPGFAVSTGGEDVRSLPRLIADREDRLSFRLPLPNGTAARVRVGLPTAGGIAFRFLDVGIGDSQDVQRDGEWFTVRGGDPRVEVLLPAGGVGELRGELR